MFQKIQRRNGMKAMQRSATSLIGLVSGVPVLLAGLVAFETHPVLGVLLTLASMALLLSATGGLCEAEVHEPRLRRKCNKGEYINGG